MSQLDEEALFGFRGSSFIGAPFEPHKVCDLRSLFDLLTIYKEKNETQYPYDMHHVSMTYSAICTLLTLGDDLKRLNRKAIIRSLKNLQQPNGSFSSSTDRSECDMRFLYCACAISYMLNDWSGLDKDLAVKYIMDSIGYEYGFGQGPGQESHGGSTYCAIASLALLNRLDVVGIYDHENNTVGYGSPPENVSEEGMKLIQWLVQKQVSGICGRTNKYQDSCYSWWVGASLQLLGCFEFLDEIHLRGFIMMCKDDIGGFGKSPDASTDFLHTYFSLCGLAFLDEPDIQKAHCGLGISLRTYERLKELNNSLQGK